MNKTKEMKRIREIVEAEDWVICSEPCLENKLIDLELEKYTPAGEDFIITITFDGTLEDFTHQVFKAYDEFDEEDHIEMWVEAQRQGRNGVPSVYALVDDAPKISEMLADLYAACASALKHKHIEEDNTMKGNNEMEDATYNPTPVDTSSITLPQELMDLTESIAENVHDVWAAGRIAEGWKYGNVKNSELKTTPCLVPYGELTEGEKSYDRNTALETLKLILTLGYTIVSPKASGSEEV